MFNRTATMAALSLAFAFSAPSVAAQDAPQVQEDARNPAPSQPLNAYQHFELVPVAMGAPFAGQKGNEVAREHLQADLDERIGPLLQQWNGAGGDATRALKIQPEIRYVRFITGGKRFFAGAFAGGSAILVKVRLLDAASGAVVAEPEFYQHANAMGAAWSFGATDKTMLIRIANMLTAYLKDNYAATVGGSVSQAPEVED